MEQVKFIIRIHLIFILPVAFVIKELFNAFENYIPVFDVRSLNVP